jgi:hypothetical protein
MSATDDSKRCDNLACGCGHGSCEAEIDEQLHGGIGKETL